MTGSFRFRQLHACDAAPVGKRREVIGAFAADSVLEKGKVFSSGAQTS
jgi:hypothetical protein